VKITQKNLKIGIVKKAGTIEKICKKNYRNFQELAIAV